ncbi:MAG: DNA polymerase III subunit gamma/tau [Candidatus Levybacteria bacterium]|nr:DNA polymerase III subunit gamma/tau [Candidatus Levybacteria bacterium]
MVYYRKYRPQKISELDLPQVREKLTAILSSKELPHAFLFTGSKGLGKTSSARILAKAINCENNSKFKDQNSKLKVKNTNPEIIDNKSSILNRDLGIEPCNSCEACISITNGSNIDVLEIDAASNGGVEEIRTLRERVKFSSANLRYKVYIIDEVHMLSTGAFNALLKTLEEPPSHVIFILATTELWKLPATVVSRAFQVLFEKPTTEQIATSLERIVKGEKLVVEPKVLEEIAKLSDGAFRDGAKLLEELVLAARGQRITKELFDVTFKTKGMGDEVYMLLEAYEARDAKKALEVIGRLQVNGADFKIVMERLVDQLRGLLMLRNSIESPQKDVKGLTIEDIKNLLELANEAYGELKFSIIPQLPLELMTVKFCILDEEKEEGKTKNNELSIGSEEVGDKSQGYRDDYSIKEKQFQGEVVAKPKASLIAIKDEESKVASILPRLMALVNEKNKPAAALLRSCKKAVFEDDTITISTPFPIHAERLLSEKVFPDLQNAGEELMGRKVDVRIVTLTQ